MSPAISSRVSRIVRTLIGVAATAVIPVLAHAQSPGTSAIEEPVCYRFVFGAWTPALDKTAAGHDPAARGGPGAPNGRDWAVSDFGSGVSLMLFPGWWPAGVSIRLPGQPPVVGDSATGTATALVADGRKRPPTAPITVIGVPCGAPVAADPTAPARAP